LRGKDGLDKRVMSRQVNKFPIPRGDFPGHSVLKRLEIRSTEAPNGER
jgi:hypothetical protein